MPTVRLALAQTNPIVGAFEANAQAIVQFSRQAHEKGADIVAFGEMSLSGYPIEDLAIRPGFLEASRRAVQDLAHRLDAEGLGNIPVIVGYPDGPLAPPRRGQANPPKAIAQNCAAILHRGAIIAQYAKHHLPNYSVFDECRTFIPGDRLLVLNLNDVDVAIMICEDLWHNDNPMVHIHDANVSILIVINASPFERDKDNVRLQLVTSRAQESNAVVAYVNIVGGQDDLVFDGNSIVVNKDGVVVARAAQFVEELVCVDVDALPRAEKAPRSQKLVGGDVVTVPQAERENRQPIATPIFTQPIKTEQVWNALVLGLRDYIEKNGFASALIGLSGGIDSAVCAVLAVDAIGPGRVHGVSMPSRYSSDHSRSDAKELADRIEISFRVEPIDDFFRSFQERLGFNGVAAENLQARVRGVVLMGLSNAEGHLVLATGNKSELAVGYSTIYGDSVGGFAPIRDIPKTLVWDLARWRNEIAESRAEVPPIPTNSIMKPPSAELRPDQRDQDTLPDYTVLDAILDAYITQRKSRVDVIALGFDESTVNDVIRLVDRAEWKRRQGAIGPKISALAFGRDRRLPITFRPQ